MPPIFGVNVDQSTGADPVGDARHAESLGFDFVTVTDHLHGERPSFETWTLLTWIAASTTRVKVATNVLGLPYRPPTVVAKMAESLDRLSGGRLILGLGAGGSNAEFAAFGLVTRTPREKIDALAEGIEIIRGLWSEPDFSFKGEHYRTDAARIEPRPERRIPVWIGAYGQRSVALTGRVADGWIPSMFYAPVERAVRLRTRLREAAERAGRDPDEITCAYNVPVRFGPPVPEDRRRVTGSAAEVTDRLAEIVASGFTAINLWVRDRESRERLSAEVIPELRRAAT